MALDGITIAGIRSELSRELTGARISKIQQPEADALMLTFKNQKETKRLFISSGASLPLIYFTDKSMANPMTAPNFCMLLRKHIGGGRIIDVTQPGLERIIILTIEHLDEMGDVCRKKLICEFMGKHSNIIFCDEEDRIIDSIKHIPLSVSSVREVLPGRTWFIPDTMKKTDPLECTPEQFSSVLAALPMPVRKALYSGLTGLSPVMASEIIYTSGIDGDKPAAELSELELIHLYGIFRQFMDEIREENFAPSIYIDHELPVEFAALKLSHLSSLEETNPGSVSEMLETYYSSREAVTRIRQKSADLRRVVNSVLERDRKKYDLQLRQLKDTEKRDKYRINGELIQTYGYSAAPGAKELVCVNFYTGREVKIALDPSMTPQENAARCFEKYAKLKRTYEALVTLTEETGAEITYLESVSAALDIAVGEEDLTQIKEELRESGFIKKRGPKDKKVRITSVPFHYLSGDGYHIYVGKNNLQNEELTFNLATGNDLWFHAKAIPGSHVIVKTEGKTKEELPDRLFEEAAGLAAYYSKGRMNEKVEIDYIEKKQIRKVSGAKPGFVIYHTNYSMVGKPSLKGLKELL